MELWDKLCVSFSARFKSRLSIGCEKKFNVPFPCKAYIVLQVNM